jgi:hypothetical protein
MRLHYLQHVPFEDLARIEDWAEDRCHEISRTFSLMVWSFLEWTSSTGW